jgi:hypothetical protein
MWEMVFGMYEKKKCGAFTKRSDACDICPVVRGARYAAEVCVIC